MIEDRINKHVPGKRIKTWHRHAVVDGHAVTLRAFAKELLAGGSDAQKKTANAWITRKASP